jgi:hypothetical protein
MADEPKFPSPDEAKRKSADVKITPSEPRAAVVVQRAEPVPESTDVKKKEAAKLTPDEVRALLAVSEVNRPSRTTWKRRGRVIAVPTLILSVVAHLATAYWPVVVGGLLVGALVWMFGPWKAKQDEWG